MLKAGLVPASATEPDPILAMECLGLKFKSPVGLAAGFDKNAETPDAILAQGFGFVEAGTVTPLAQPGNTKPRMFRLKEDEAIINRLGFNNYGLEVFTKNLRAARHEGIIGANIGKNKDAGDAVADYVTCLQAVYAHADYITINISSPNTAGLRNLQQKEAFSALVKAITDARAALVTEGAPYKAILYKIAPDLSLHDKADIVEVALEHHIDGLIVSNTTISRTTILHSPHHEQAGGLSGKPLFALSTAALSDIYRLSQGKILLIGVGGIASAEDAYEKILSGATLIQLYSALVYQGFGLVRDIHNGLAAKLRQNGFTHITEAIGTGVL